MKIFLVGGAVRDELLGLPVKERDWVVVGASPEEMLNRGFTPVGKSFPVFLHPDTREEYALARTERKVGGGYHGFSFNAAKEVTLIEDLKRRDLTINAMAKTLDSNIIDPYGGQQDLRHKILRHVSLAFIEDPVRVLRIARFAARFAPLGFQIAPETLDLMKSMVKSGELDYLIPERVWKEFATALQEETPLAFIQTLRQCGALEKLLPEIDVLYGVPQDKKYHPEIDTGIHTELVLQQATQLTTDPSIRFAAILHDIGKGLTAQTELPKHPLHEIRGEDLVIALCQRLRVPTEYQSLAQLVTKYHGECHQALEKDAEGILTLLEACDAFRRPERFAKFLIACTADSQGRPGYENIEYLQAKRLDAALGAAQEVNIPKVIASSPANKDNLQIKEAIRKARIQAIKEAKL